MTSYERAILRTLVYADIFDYPVTVGEIQRWLISSSYRNSSRKEILQILRGLKGVFHKEGYFFLSKKQALANKRKERAIWSSKKIAFAQKTSRLLSRIPSVRLVGVSGGLAWNNAKEHDDIDFFIITAHKTMWLTRLLSVTLLDFFGLRRKPNSKRLNNAICLNMFMDENYLTIPEKEQDLFAAHEVLSMRALFAKDDMYDTFIKANTWARTYLPNAFPSYKGKQTRKRSKREEKTNKRVIFKPILDIVEAMSKKTQLLYMRRRRTTEVVGEGMLRFHPKDARKWILSSYKKNLASLGIPEKEIQH